jgi:protein tyrosine/serine phosphatase
MMTKESMKRFMTSKYKIAVLTFVFLLLSAASYFFYMEEQGNFHTITPGEAYRSAQLDADELEHYINKYNLNSIVNLRGEHPDEPWYGEEINVCTKHNVKHYNIPLSSSREPDETVVRNLIEIFKNAPHPVLIHCQAGADRSGLAAAMWKVFVDKEPKSEAGKQLSLLYGHLPIGKTTAMDRFFQKWNPPLN